MTPVEVLCLLDDIEDGKVSKSDPRYVALLKRDAERAREWDAAEERKRFPQWREMVESVKAGRWGTLKELAAGFGMGASKAGGFKRVVLKQQAMSEEEWRLSFAAGRSKKKRQQKEPRA